METAGIRGARDTGRVSDPGGPENLSHEQLLSEGYTAFNRRDSERLRQLMVADFQWNEAAEVPGRKVCRSADEFVGYMEGFDQLWDEFAFDLLDLEPGSGDALIARVRGYGKGKASTHEFELTIHHVWRFRDNRVARMDAFLDRRDAMDAAGLG